jgi:DNA-directed RNA polymerase specialized sigma24 family protein
MNVLLNTTIQQTQLLDVLQRPAEKDKTAVADCVDAYGNFIWALARKFTASNEEAAAAAQEIFTDIRQYSERAEQAQSPEDMLTALIARRRLIRYLQ